MPNPNVSDDQKHGDAELRFDRPKVKAGAASKSADEINPSRGPNRAPLPPAVDAVAPAAQCEPARAHTTLREIVGEIDPDPAADANDEFPDPKLGDYQEFFIPICGFVRFTEAEIAIIDHPAFQRLGKIYQLGQSFLVYRGATHKRFEHVLGTVHVAQKMINAVRSNYYQFNAKGLAEHTSSSFEHPLTLDETRFIRLAALLHDIGHLPAGHTLEDELCLLEPHDANRRLDLVFNKTDWVPGVESRKLGDLINDLYKNCPAGAKTAPVEIVRAIISKDAELVYEIDGIRVEVCRDIVGNTICADLLDYLHRDWHHIGKPRFFETRIFQYMQIRRDLIDGRPKFVLSYGQHRRPKSDVVSAVLDLLESRYNLAEAVLFHSSKCAATAMLERAVSELYRMIPAEPKHKREKWLSDLEDRLLYYSDDEMISTLLRDCVEQKCELGKALLQAIALRNLCKSVCLVTYDRLDDAGVYDLLLKRYVGESPKGPKASVAERRQAAANRVEALAMFEKDFNIPAGSLVMYCPPAKMNSKIAEVKIIRRDGIRTLSEWDEKKEKLAGGHCKAQLERFQSLWRAEIFLRGDQRDAMDQAELKLLEECLKVFVLGIKDDSTLDAKAIDLARTLSARRGSPYAGKEPSLQLAARGGVERYPMGAPSVRALFGY